MRDGKKLRLGYTTGSCAAAAAKAAAWMLLSGRRKETIRLLTPKGMELTLAVEDIHLSPSSVRCAIRKDSGDDPDITRGTLIYAEVRKTEIAGIVIDGGQGVGRVTKPGLDQPVGAAAINSVPRRMIRENVEEVCGLLGYTGGLLVVISVPEGETLAKKTFNPRLGIEGGISILGTTGIVEPMSEQALVDTIHVELRQRRESGADYVLLAPGNYGADYIKGTMGIDPATAVMTSNFIGDALEMCRELGFRGALLIGHIGKLVKLAGGMWNTHSRYGDCRIPVKVVLDLACGTGTMTWLLTGRGYELIGVDGSEEMLAAAMSKGGTVQGVPPIFLHQSMPQLDLYGTVDAAICCLDSLNYLTDPADVRRTFRRLHLFVAPGGVLVFDVNTVAKLAALDGQVFLDETEDTYCVWRAEYHKGLCTYYMDLFRRRGDRAWDRREELHRERAYTVEELTAWLTEAGFGDIRVYGDAKLRHPREDEQRVYFCCIRN